MRKKHQLVRLRRLKGNGLGERIPLEPQKGLGRKAEDCEHSIPQGSKLRGLADSSGPGERKQTATQFWRASE